MAENARNPAGDGRESGYQSLSGSNIFLLADEGNPIGIKGWIICVVLYQFDVYGKQLNQFGDNMK